EQRIDRAADEGRRGVSTVLLLRHDHRDELPAAGHQIGQETARSLQNRPQRRPGLLAEQREQPSIHGVRLRQEAHALAETPPASWVDHDHGQAGLEELLDQPSALGYGLAQAALAIVRASLRQWSGDPGLLTVSRGTQALAFSRSGLKKTGRQFA